jgi:hypothetical protein
VRGVDFGSIPARRERRRVEIERGNAEAPRHRPDRPEPAVRENRRIDDTDTDSDTEADGVLTDPQRLAAEHQAYRAIVVRDYGAARDQWAEAVPELRAGWEKIAGFANRFKGEDRLKEKIADRIRSKGHTPEQALARIPDVVRLTYEYRRDNVHSGRPARLAAPRRQGVHST